MNILAIVHYAQNFFDKILEPLFAKEIINSTISLNREVNLSYKEIVGNAIASCKDEDLLEQIIYTHSELLQDSDKRKMYFNHVFYLIAKYCEQNKIQCTSDNLFNLNLKW